MNLARVSLLVMYIFFNLDCVSYAQPPWRLNEDGSTTIEAERPIQVSGRNGLTKREVASRGEVLGGGWGTETGHFAEVFFRTEKVIKPARIRFKYARKEAGHGWLDLILDSIPIGRVKFESTNGDGTKKEDYKEVSIDIPYLKSGFHRLYLTSVSDGVVSQSLPQTKLQSNSILDVVGNRTDKNSVGHGKNLAVYTGRGQRKRFFYATHELGNIFSGTDGETLNWFPDHILLEGNSVRPKATSELFIDTITFLSRDEKSQLEQIKVTPNQNRVIEQRQVCVTKDDVVVSQIFLKNQTDENVTHTIKLSGDCRKSFDWREKPTGTRETTRHDDFVVMVDKSVFPDALSEGLNMAIGANIRPEKVDAEEPGKYQLIYKIALEPNESRSIIAACSLDRSKDTAIENLKRVIQSRDPVASNRRDWEKFYSNQVPVFECSDKSLNELYGFRLFLLKFSTSGGDLGQFKYPVVMEGRQAYQTYCCYSAPFMAFDMNWHVNPKIGFGHIANMAHASYEDGRFPWYTSPRTNKVKLNHTSRSGLSLLPHTAWKHFLIHSDKDLLKEIYPSMAKNCQWWIQDRDPNQDGLFDVAHQLETGQDDLFRWGEELKEMRYDAVDATSYAVLNLRATANMARVLGHEDDFKRLSEYAEKSAKALNSLLWSEGKNAYYDRHPKTKKLSDHYLAITTFYPLFARIGGKEKTSVFEQILLDENKFWLPHPVPALPKDHPDYGTTNFWEGPAWPAATSHVVEGFATFAKEHNRELLPQAAQLLRRSANNHLNPRADFYERYNPETGDGLSLFRDYMHSWWIDLYIRHIAGIMISDDGTVSIDPLPMKFDYFKVTNVPIRGKIMDVYWSKSNGLEVMVNRKQVIHQADFKLGDTPIQVPIN